MIQLRFVCTQSKPISPSNEGFIGYSEYTQLLHIVMFVLKEPYVQAL